MKRLLLLLTIGLCGSVCAQEAVLPSPDAKSLAMGGLDVTLTGTSHQIYNNVAMASFSPQPIQISSSYYGRSDYDYYALSGSARIGMRSLVHAGWRQFLREKNSNDKAADLGYSRSIGTEFAVGVVGRYTHLRRGEIAADALAFDLCGAWSHPLQNMGSYSTLRVGAKLANLGGYFGRNSNGYKMPVNLTTGATLDTFVTDAHEITVGVETGYYFNPSTVQGWTASIGAEYNLMQLVQLRAGYHYGEKRAYSPSYASVGAGVRFLHLRLDFAYLFAKKESFLRNTYSLSFGLDF